MTEISPKIPVEYSALKEAVRKGLINNASRYYWWPNLPSVSSTGEIETAPDSDIIAERLAELLSEEAISADMEESSKGKDKEIIVKSSNSILEVLMKTRIIGKDDVHGIEPIIRILMHIIKRAEVACMLVGDLLTNQDKYIDTNPDSYAKTLSEFRDTLNTFSPKTYASLYGIGALEDRFLDLMFRDFFIELLPPDVVLRVIDAFLLEGNRIIFRYGLAIIRAYKTQIKAGLFQTATNFWHAVKADAANAATKANTPMLFKTIAREEKLPIVDAFVIFSKAKNPEFLETNMVNDYPFDEDRSTISKMMRPMTLNTRRSTFTGTLTSPFASLNANNAPPGSQKVTRKASVSGLSTRSSVTDMFMNNTQSSAQGGEGGSSTAPIGVLARRGSASAASFKDGMSSKARSASADLNGGSTADLGGSPAQTVQQQTVFRGTDSTFTSPVASGGDSMAPGTQGSMRSPVPGGAVVNEGVLMDIDQAASGIAFSSNVLDSVGTKQLLTALDRPIPLGGYHQAFSATQHGYRLSALYSAVGTCSPLILLVQLAAPHEHITLGAYLNTSLEPSTQCRGDAFTTCFRIDRRGTKTYRAVAGQSDSELTEFSNSTLLQFVTATPTVLAFGGSQEHGTNALRLDDALHKVFSGPTDTFANSALLGEEDGANGASAYEVKEVEVFCALPSACSRTTASASVSAASKVFSDINDDL